MKCYHSNAQNCLDTVAVLSLIYMEIDFYFVLETFVMAEQSLEGGMAGGKHQITPC